MYCPASVLGPLGRVAVRPLVARHAGDLDNHSERQVRTLLPRARTRDPVDVIKHAGALCKAELDVRRQRVTSLNEVGSLDLLDPYRPEQQPPFRLRSRGACTEALVSTPRRSCGRRRSPLVTCCAAAALGERHRERVGRPRLARVVRDVPHAPAVPASGVARPRGCKNARIFTPLDRTADRAEPGRASPTGDTPERGRPVHTTRAVIAWHPWCRGRAPRIRLSQFATCAILSSMKL